MLLHPKKKKTKREGDLEKREGYLSLYLSVVRAVPVKKGCQLGHASQKPNV